MFNKVFYSATLCKLPVCLIVSAIRRDHCSSFKGYVQRIAVFAVSQVCSMIEVILNDRLGKKIRVKCNEDDNIGDLKKLVAA